MVIEQRRLTPVVTGHEQKALISVASCFGIPSLSSVGFVIDRSVRPLLNTTAIQRCW